MPVEIATASRLHFGLLRFEQPDGPSYGGLGMMIAAPRWVIDIGAADAWGAAGADSERALDIARRVLQRVDAPRKLPALAVRIREAIPAHRGLGGGTQLGLAVAAGVCRLLGLADPSAAELAVLAERGRRSAIGTHGFVHGGLLWELGRQPGQPLGELAQRVAVPAAWCIVLVDAGETAGYSGAAEVDAFQRLPAVSAATTGRLRRLAEETILPAAACGDYDAFAASLYDYGRTAGQCFAAVQGGPYATPAVARCVDAIRKLGVAAVGQSSWGPTVFAITAGAEQAEQLCAALSEDFPDLTTCITAPLNRGAVLR